MKVAVIGAGTIGSAVAKALAKNYEVIATRRRIEKIKWLEEYGIEITSDNRTAAKVADIVIIAVKPNKIKRVLDEIREDIKGKIVISLAAAISLETLESLADAKFVRAMPNIAVLVGESFTAYATRNLDENEIRIIEDIFKTFGMCAKVEEEYMDAITGLSGSGPAYVSVFLEALMYGGLRVGLPRDVAILASAQTLLGTAKLLLELDLHPAQIRDMVITPGGTTIDGIFELEDSRIRNALMKAVDAATKKSRILRLELEKKMK